MTEEEMQKALDKMLQMGKEIVEKDKKLMKELAKL
jgi:hypothetical protein